MKTIRLGASGIDVSAVGLGGIQFSKISARKTARIIHEAIDLGVTFLETAYGYFDSEEKIGAALGRWRPGVVLASKSGSRDGKTFTVQLDESLRRLRTDCIDIYQLHGVDSPEMLDQALRPRGAVRAAQNAIRQGKIRSLGITSHSLELSLKAVDTGLFESLQYPISLINTEVPRSGLLSKTRSAGMGLIAMKPLGGGRLGNPRLALGYIYRFRGVVPVVGVETAEQVRQLVRIASRPPKLTPKHFDAIRTLRRTVGATFCRACRYCEPCPQDIAIFRVLYFPVYVKQMGAKRVLKGGLPDYLARAETCTRCGRCKRRCPFHLHIPDGLSASVSLARNLLRS